MNVEGVRSLVSNAQRAGVKRFVHCSSIGVYGKIKNPPADEQSPCHPDIAYEKTKLAGEQAPRRCAGASLKISFAWGRVGSTVWRA